MDPVAAVDQKRGVHVWKCVAVAVLSQTGRLVCEKTAPLVCADPLVCVLHGLWRGVSVGDHSNHQSIRVVSR